MIRSFFLCLALPLLIGTPGTCVHAQTSSYDFDNPRLVAELPDELDEISGLSLSPRGSQELLAVQDEEGKVYRLNTRTGQMMGAFTFWKDGDYEGIEAVGQDIWVVKSTGTLYRIRNAGMVDQEVEKYNGDLSGENDVEGLAYDAPRNRLLLACKRDADDDGNDKDGRYIYAFDLTTNTLSDRPVYAIAREAVRSYLGTCPKTSKHPKLCSFFIEQDDYDLAPSAVAVHPTTGQLYLVSSVGKILMILNASGQIDYLHKLDKDTYAQPEGLAFGADGTLYISSERKGDRPARLYQLDDLAR